MPRPHTGSVSLEKPSSHRPRDCCLQRSHMHDNSFIIVRLSVPGGLRGPWPWLDPSLPSSKPSLMSWHHRRLQVPLGLLGPQPWRCLPLSEEPCSETATGKWPHPSPSFRGTLPRTWLKPRLSLHLGGKKNTHLFPPTETQHFLQLQMQRTAYSGESSVNADRL